MWWRLSRIDYRRQKGSNNRQLMKNLVESNSLPGILAYDGNIPVGWCSVGPRDQFPALDRSRYLKRVDDKPVWSVVCFYIARSYRKSGITKKLLDFTIGYCREQGAAIIEGYPVDPVKPKITDDSAYTGFASVFLKAGFKEVARRSETRPIMRYIIQ